jgi:MFS family permease
MPSEEHLLQYQGWCVVGACGVGVFFATLPLNTFAVFLKPLCDYFAWSRESAASAYGTLTLVAALSAPLFGRLMDRIGVRRVVIPCLALSGVAVASLAVTTSSLWHLRAVFGVLGLAMMGASPIAYSRAIFGWFDTLRGRALGLMLTGAAISGVVLPLAASTLIEMLGWRAAWIVLGLVTLLIAVPIAARFIRERQGATDRSVAGTGVPLEQALRSRVFWTLALVVFGGTVATNGALVHLVALLADRGVPASQAALPASAMGAASLAGRLITGLLLDRFAARRVSVCLLTIAALGTFLLAGAHSLWLGVLASMCIGFGAGGEVDIMPYLLSRYFGLRSLSTLYGLNWTAWGLAGATGPMVLGRAFDATGSYATALVELGAMTLVAAALMLSLPPVIPAQRQ